VVYWDDGEAAMGVVIIVGAAALVLGWHFSQAHMSHRAIPGRRATLGPLRRDRTRHLLRFVGVAVLIVVLFVLITRRG
jgi:hypothetical protein